MIGDEIKSFEMNGIHTFRRMITLEDGTEIVKMVKLPGDFTKMKVFAAFDGGESFTLKNASEAASTIFSSGSLYIESTGVSIAVIDSRVIVSQGINRMVLQGDKRDVFVHWLFQVFG